MDFNYLKKNYLFLNWWGFFFFSDFWLPSTICAVLSGTRWSRERGTGWKVAERRLWMDSSPWVPTSQFDGEFSFFASQAQRASFKQPFSQWFYDTFSVCNFNTLITAAALAKPWNLGLLNTGCFSMKPSLKLTIFNTSKWMIGAYFRLPRFTLSTPLRLGDVLVLTAPSATLTKHQWLGRFQTWGSNSHVQIDV